METEHSLPSAAELESVQMVAADVPRGIGDLLRERREAVRMPVAELARRTGLTRGTIRNIELGITTPSPSTMRRLAGIAALKLSPADLHSLSSFDENAAWQPDVWFSPEYNPLRIAREMSATLNGPGGQLDQTYLYVDLQGASDWYALCNAEKYTTAFRAEIPLDKVADRMLRESHSAGIDVDALGSGDCKTETALVQRLADRMPPPPDLRLYLLDISHTLLSSGFRYASDALGGRRVAVFALHGSFYDIARLPVLYYRPAGIRRIRVYSLLGYTIGNLTDEPGFFRNLAQCAAPGDLALVDCQVALADAGNPEAVRSTERLMRSKTPPQSHMEFLSGPLLRHCRGLKRLELSVRLNFYCSVPGSYAVDSIADVQMNEGPPRQFMVWRVKRYDPAKLGDCLTDLGWEPVQTWRYGPEKSAAIMLLRRRG